MTTKASMLNKIAVSCFCSQTACGVAQCYNMWTCCESCGLANLNQSACCWALCAPICHECKMGDTGEAAKRCGLCVKYSLFGCALSIVAPCDACYNCICYNKDNCTEGVSGFKDIVKHSQWLGKKVQTALGLTTSNEPEKTYGEYRP